MVFTHFTAPISSFTRMKVKPQTANPTYSFTFTSKRRRDFLHKADSVLRGPTDSHLQKLTDIKHRNLSAASCCVTV